MPITIISAPELKFTPLDFKAVAADGAFEGYASLFNKEDLGRDVVLPGAFVFNRATQAVIRKMKDGDGNYLWQPASKAGEASMLMGYPVAESEDMPAIATNSYSVAFGDFRRGYLIVDRVGIRVLRDPYSSKPYVLFYTTNCPPPRAAPPGRPPPRGSRQ
jgi:HK97 family phage major capsid protein